MTDLSFLAAAAAPTHLNPVTLFLEADIVVQVVMAGLILASVWVWMIVFSFSSRFKGLSRSCDLFETEFWRRDNPESVLGEKRFAASPVGAVVSAGLAEFEQSTVNKKYVPEAASARIGLAMASQVGAEADALSARLNFLATTGAVAPFVGLFGTVWGIMNSFFQIGQQQNSSLAVVAPGISEALFATAIGLFAAIPAVIAYNRFTHNVNLFEGRLQRFADRYQNVLGRELERR
jgi:biopolymer transport protein TolQ